MKSDRYAITFACYNQVDYTKKCIESMVLNGDDLSRLAIVDNASSDNTREYLDTLPLGAKIYNHDNLGCGVAWNQGVLAMQAEWSIIMNNDVLVGSDWIEGLIETAEKHGLKVISPSLIEGDLDYDFHKLAITNSSLMKDALRIGSCHAVCIAIHHSVWKDVGYFQPVPKLLGYEDTMFFNELKKAGIEVATTGASWLHHFGSITQTAMKQERGLSKKDNLGPRKNYQLLKQSWFARKLKKMHKRIQHKIWYRREIDQYKMTMHGVRVNGEFIWQ